MKVMQCLKTLINVRLERLEQTFQARETWIKKTSCCGNPDEEEDSEQNESDSDPII